MSLVLNNSHKKTILVGMSGGVDSSVTALLLKEQGHHIEGVFMKNWEEDDTETYCPASIDMADAQAVCDKLQIELHRVNFAEEYWQRVFTHFLAEYQAGRTPNPDILCNKEIKFKAFLQFAKQHGADYIATGHYARIREKEGKFELLKGLDNQKDQSYFLHALDQSQLRESLFPIGELNKDTVRIIANKAGLKNHAKKDSTGICFIGERKFKQFLNTYLPAKPGLIETLDGKVIGHHDGLMFYTMGQRQGLQIGGQKNSLQAPWYVVAKNIPQNTLIVTQGSNHPSLFATTLWAQSLHWINQPPTFPFQTYAKTRYRQTEQPCIINQIDNNQYRVDFEEAQRALTPGQSIVFYQNDVCLGGGIITHTHL
ncbi:MAG: tRNA 2-thiouridine(34) synthase MnmA [Gammaproteobacteria bacterium]|nr:tRNA 2-thiouridine(34) synthase MnmA [Gammaproteobacteria bacterium]